MNRNLTLLYSILGEKTSLVQNLEWVETFLQLPTLIFNGIICCKKHTLNRRKPICLYRYRTKRKVLILNSGVGRRMEVLTSEHNK